MNPERPILRYFGGKWVLAPWIIENLPEHRTYVEPFGGAASVLLRKPRAYAEVYNDLDREIVNVFRVAQNHGQRLKRKLELTPYSREEFDLAHHKTSAPIESARRCVIRSFMGFGADSLTGPNKSGFRSNSNRSGTTPAHDWINYPSCLDALIERLRGVVIENRDAWQVMLDHDREDTLHFVDPPYVTGSRQRKKAYRFEMTDRQHRELLSFLKNLSGMVVLCGYHNEVYQDLGWKFIERKAFADGANERTEVLWFNSAAAKAGAQQSLFSEAVC